MFTNNLGMCGTLPPSLQWHRVVDSVHGRTNCLQRAFAFRRAHEYDVWYGDRLVHNMRVYDKSVRPQDLRRYVFTSKTRYNVPGHFWIQHRGLVGDVDLVYGQFEFGQSGSRYIGRRANAEVLNTVADYMAIHNIFHFAGFGGKENVQRTIAVRVAIYNILWGKCNVTCS